MTGDPLKNLRGPEFKALLRTLPFGKRLPSAVYVHREALAAASGRISEVVSELIQVHEIGAEFNIIKFHLDTPKLTFLEYPQFFEDPHPALAHSILVDLSSGKRRAFDYTSNPNPPILHRKETFLLIDDPRAPKFAALTAAEEAEGLYEDTTTIGFKLNWEKLLAAKGLGYSGENLVRSSSPRNDAAAPAPSIDRHKTALTRFDFSKPIKTIFEHGLLRQNSTILDYGCGPGSDVAGLRSMGYEVDGWDPVFRPESQKKPAEVVNLGYSTPGTGTNQSGSCTSIPTTRRGRSVKARNEFPNALSRKVLLSSVPPWTMVSPVGWQMIVLSWLITVRSHFSRADSSIGQALQASSMIS